MDLKFDGKIKQVSMKHGCLLRISNLGFKK